MRSRSTTVADDTHRETTPTAASTAANQGAPDAKMPCPGLLDYVDVVVFATDDAGRFTWLNRAWTDLTGIPVAESLGRWIAGDLVADQPDLATRSLAGLLAGEREDLRQEFKVSTRGGPVRWAEMRARVMRGADGAPQGCAGTLVDITDRRWIEQTSRRFAEHLEARVAERTQAFEEVNASLEAFAYAVSHELRAPLRSILGFVSVLKDDFDRYGNDDGAQAVARIEADAQRMVALIERMLHHSRVGQVALHPQAVNCAALVQEVITELQPELSTRQVTFKVNVDVPCRADPVLLRQVFSNLIGNAVKYTRGRSDAHVDIEARQEGDAIVFSVRDNGIGFDPAQAAKLFTVFQRLHAEPQYEGSGVGLATVKRIVDRHGGRVWADSRKGDGATFYFSLPAEPSE